MSDMKIIAWILFGLGIIASAVFPLLMIFATGPFLFGLSLFCFLKSEINELKKQLNKEK